MESKEDGVKSFLNKFKKDPTSAKVVFKNNNFKILRAGGKEARFLVIEVRDEYDPNTCHLKIARWYCSVCKIVPDKECFKNHTNKILLEDPSGNNPYLGNIPVIDGMQDLI